MKSIPFTLCAVVILFLSTSASAQGVAFNTTGVKADSSAMLDVKSTTQGLLLPRMTLVQRNAITNPADGLIIFQTDNTRGLYYYDAVTSHTWVAVTTAPAVIYITAPTHTDSTSTIH